MNRRGITLVELLAVIVIMGLILLLVIPSMLRVSEEGTIKQYEQAVQALESASISYVEIVNPNGLNRIGSSITITIDDLRRERLITIPFINPMTKEELPTDAIITITKTGDRDYKVVLPL